MTRKFITRNSLSTLNIQWSIVVEILFQVEGSHDYLTDIISAQKNWDDRIYCMTLFVKYTTYTSKICLESSTGSSHWFVKRTFNGTEHVRAFSTRTQTVRRQSASKIDPKNEIEKNELGFQKTKLHQLLVIVESYSLRYSSLRSKIQFIKTDSLLKIRDRFRPNFCFV